MTSPLQSREVTLVNLVALALKIRTEIAAMFRAFIPLETKPTEPIVDRLRASAVFRD